MRPWVEAVLETGHRIKATLFSNKGPLLILEDPDGKEIVRVLVDTGTRRVKVLLGEGYIKESEQGSSEKTSSATRKNERES